MAGGSRVAVPFPVTGFRRPRAGGGIRAESVLGSVSADALLEIGGLVRVGNRLVVDRVAHEPIPAPAGEWGALFRMGARRPAVRPAPVPGG